MRHGAIDLVVKPVLSMDDINFCQIESLYYKTEKI